MNEICVWIRIFVFHIKGIKIYLIIVLFKDLLKKPMPGSMFAEGYWKYQINLIEKNEIEGFLMNCTQILQSFSKLVVFMIYIIFILPAIDTQQLMRIWGRYESFRRYIAPILSTTSPLTPGSLIYSTNYEQTIEDFILYSLIELFIDPLLVLKMPFILN